MFEFLETEEYDIKPIYDETAKMQTFDVEQLTVPQACPNCGSQKFRKKGKYRHRKIIDEHMWDLVRINLHQQRYSCNSCNTYFTPPCQYEKGIQHTQESAHFIAQTMIDDGISISEMSKRYDISNGTISDILKNYTEEFNKRDFQLKACSKIFFHKFQYGNKFGCCICGSDGTDSNDLKLLGIYEEYSAETVKYFFYKISSLDNIKTIFHDFDPDVTFALQDYFRRVDVVVRSESLTDSLLKIAAASRSEIKHDCTTFANEIKTMIRKNDRYMESYQNSLPDEIENKLKHCSQEIQEEFSPFIKQMMENKKAFELILQNKKSEFSMSPVMDIIREIRKSKLSFHLMIIRMMILSKAVRTQIKSDIMGKYLRREPSTMFMGYAMLGSDDSIYTYYVDVNELSKEILNKKDTAPQ